MNVNLKYKKHPNIIVIQNKCKDNGSFYFIEVDRKQTEKEILMLEVNKASQSYNIPVKVVKENVNIFSFFLWNGFNNSIKLLIFPEILKHLDIYQRKLHAIQLFSKFIRNEKIWKIKNACLNKCHCFLRIYFSKPVWVQKGFQYTAMSSRKFKKKEMVCR